MHRGFEWLKGAAFLVLAAVSPVGGTAPDSASPSTSKIQHLGVATCAGSNCHGSQRPVVNSNVRQDEYVLWQRFDKHARAHKALVSPAGKRIADNLGIKDAASAPQCLTCHSDYVPAEQRGQKFDLGEGVSCEACHGGAKTWLGPHVSGNTHAQNLEAGLYPLENPVARARLCLDCHLGSTDKPIDHKMMGAGHPALKFELDLYSNTQSTPPHFTIDKDYRQRKSYTTNARMWIVGQLMASEFYLDGLLSNRFADRGMFPELVFFDCDACHHPIGKLRWNPGASGPLGSGQPRLADANLVVAGVILASLAPEAGKDWAAALKQLHAASADSVPRVRDAAKGLKTVLASATQGLITREITRAQALALIKSLTELGAGQRYGDLAATSQVYFGVDALFAFLGKEHGLAASTMQTERDQLFNAIGLGASYDSLAARTALQKISAAIDQVTP